MLAAPIPRDMVFDAGQRDVYRTPQNLESMFAGHAAPDIRADYVERVNNMLCEMYDAFSVASSPARLFYRWTDVVFVGLKIKDNTPRTEYKGKTYYFCSEDCKRDFIKDPDKYLASSIKKAG